MQTYKVELSEKEIINVGALLDSVLLNNYIKNEEAISNFKSTRNKLAHIRNKLSFDAGPLEPL